MQPTIRVTVPEPGLIHINGQFAGESRPGHPLCLPLSPFGPAYLTCLPLSGNASPMARKLVLSGGELLPESVAEAEGLSCVAWPGGLLEVELTLPRREIECFTLAGRPCLLARGAEDTLCLGGLAIPLPSGARPPRLETLAGMPLLIGGMRGGGEYLIALSPDLSAVLEQLTARQFILSGDGFTALVPEGDSVGHGRGEQWQVSPGGLRCVSSAQVWIDGAPRWPQTPEAAALAAVEAALAGRWEEARGYLAPAFAAENALGTLIGDCDLCVPMSGGAPDGRPCVGLLHVVNDHFARVRPLYFRASRSLGAQGSWQIDGMEGG